MFFSEICVYFLMNNVNFLSKSRILIKHILLFMISSEFKVFLIL